MKYYYMVTYSVKTKEMLYGNGCIRITLDAPLDNFATWEAVRKYIAKEVSGEVVILFVYQLTGERNE